MSPAVHRIVTAGQVCQIRASFEAMGLARRKIAEAFYQRLFDLAPHSRRMFPQDMELLHLKLMDTIAALVGALENPGVFQSIINQVGCEHARFGVTPSDLTVFGDALLWTWEQHLGRAFTPELKQAWTALYEAVRDDMVQAMEGRS
jgi:nitric oxide dioxygenase